MTDIETMLKHAQKSGLHCELYRRDEGKFAACLCGADGEVRWSLHCTTDNPIAAIQMLADGYLETLAACKEAE